MNQNRSRMLIQYFDFSDEFDSSGLIRYTKIALIFKKKFIFRILPKKLTIYLAFTQNKPNSLNFFTTLIITFTNMCNTRCSPWFLCVIVFKFRGIQKWAFFRERWSKHRFTSRCEPEKLVNTKKGINSNQITGIFRPPKVQNSARLLILPCALFFSG